MAALIDGIVPSNDQRVELYEEGEVWIIQTAMVAENAKPNQEIKLDAEAATALLEFLQTNQERLKKPAPTQHDEPTLPTDKPWLDGQPGEEF